MGSLLYPVKVCFQGLITVSNQQLLSLKLHSPVYKGEPKIQITGEFQGSSHFLWVQTAATGVSQRVTNSRAEPDSLAYETRMYFKMFCVGA